jgi:hypothetical protein
MLRESETLLRYIQTDREINTRGGLIYLAFGEAIKTGEDSQGLFVGISLERELYRSALVELIPFFDQMTEHRFSNLMSFVHASDFNMDRDIGLAIKRGYPLQPRNYFHTEEAYREHLAKRAMFLQSFARIKPPLYNYDELEMETEIRQHYPWQWIDAVREINPDVAAEEIAKQLIAKQDTQKFVWRIPAFVHKIPNGEECLDRIMNLIEGKIPKRDYENLAQCVSLSKSLRGKI